MIHETILNNVKTYLLNGGALTVKSCWQMFGTTELRKIASRLRQRGLNVVTRQLTDTMADGRVVRFNEYRILKSA
jgi:hypothetical protein